MNTIKANLFASLSITVHTITFLQAGWHEGGYRRYLLAE